MRYVFNKPKIKFGKAYSGQLKEWRVFDKKTSKVYQVDGFTEKEARLKLYKGLK